MRNDRLPAHGGSQFPVVTLELVGNLKGQCSADSQVGDGQMNHEDDRGSLGSGTKKKKPHGQTISYQVDCSDDDVDDRNKDAGVYTLENEQGCFVQLETAAITRHSRRKIFK